MGRQMASDIAGERGIGKLTIFVFGALTAAALYAAYNILPFYYCFYEISNQFEQIIRVASTEKDAEIRRRLMYHIKKLQLPVEPDDLKIERDGRHMRISLPYQEVFYITIGDKDYDIHTFDFHAYAEGDF